MNELSETVSHNLRFLLKITNTSKTQFAKDIGINRGTAGRALSGKTFLRHDSLDALLKKYSVNYAWLTETKAGEGGE